MTGTDSWITPVASPEETSSRRGLFLLLYALTAGVAWWSVHLVVGAALVPGVCDGLPRWLLTVNNVVCATGAATAAAAAVPSARPHTAAAAVTGRAHFLGRVALLVDVTALALVLLESLPVYVLGSCS